MVRDGLDAYLRAVGPVGGEYNRGKRWDVRGEMLSVDSFQIWTDWSLLAPEVYKSGNKSLSQKYVANNKNESARNTRCNSDLTF